MWASNMYVACAYDPNTSDYGSCSGERFHLVACVYNKGNGPGQFSKQTSALYAQKTVPASLTGYLIPVPEGA